MCLTVQEAHSSSTIQYRFALGISPPITAKKMLVKATVAMSPKAPTENSANPEAEYSSAASIACRERNVSKTLAKFFQVALRLTGLTSQPVNVCGFKASACLMKNTWSFGVFVRASQKSWKRASRVCSGRTRLATAFRCKRLHREADSVNSGTEMTSREQKQLPANSNTCMLRR